MKKLLMILTIPIFLTGCAGLGDYQADLGENYQIFRSSADNVKITYNNDTENNSSYQNVIPEKVIAVNYNENCIIAKQVGMKRNEENPNSEYEVPDETDQNHWIVEKSTTAAIGPLNEEEYNLKLDELNLDLELKSVESFR
ncbi:DUF3997 domain-containing protein [Bacillus carboniphilus]|uniref:DUF3997 domain-containing protein n=1 Tax=Bacillus carboniphilus TaxID=86663 RepID=A0ABY9JS30_9BACI|nr:DUF3997 domain-containing protein [Bacillus carboniphilus]WLR41293.1 DUF3997 domain-containing protein [Bacillus carboniphilus]